MSQFLPVLHRVLHVFQLSEGRALYNLGNVYHAKGKHIGRVGQQDPGEFPEDVRACLLQAVHYYEWVLKRWLVGPVVDLCDYWNNFVRFN